MTPHAPNDFEGHSAGAVEMAEGNRVSHRALGLPLTQGMAVLVILVVVGNLCAASAVDEPAPNAGAWLRAIGISLLMLVGLYAVGSWERKGAIRVTKWMRWVIIAWLVLGAPVVAVLQTHFHYAPSRLWSGPTALLALLAIPLGIAGTVILSYGQPGWMRVLVGCLYSAGALFVSAFFGLLTAGLHGDAL